MKVSQSSRVMIRGLTSGMFSLLEFSPDQAWWSTAENHKLFLAGHSVGWMKVQGWQPWQLVTRLYKIIAALKTYSRAAEILNNKWYNDGVSCVSRPWVQWRDARGERRPASSQPVLSLNIHIHSRPSNTRPALRAPHHSRQQYGNYWYRQYFKNKYIYRS